MSGGGCNRMITEVFELFSESHPLPIDRDKLISLEGGDFPLLFKEGIKAKSRSKRGG